MYSPNSKYFQIPEVDFISPTKKALPYSIIPIGDRQALLAWRKDQKMRAEARDSYLKPIREATRQRAISMVANQNADVSLTALDKAEIAHSKARTTIEAYMPQPKYLFDLEAPRASIGQRIKGALSDLWRAAFPDHL